MKKMHFRLYVLVCISVMISCSEKNSWTIATKDTLLKFGINNEGLLTILQLRSTSGTYNWIRPSAVIPFMSRVSSNGKESATKWLFKSASSTNKDGTVLKFVFTNENPAMELVSEWKAYDEPGPIRSTMFIKNLSGNAITVYNQESVDLNVFGDADHNRVTYVNDDASIPDSIGVYHNPLDSVFSKTLLISEKHDWIPFVMVDADNTKGIYIGWEWSVGRIKIDHPSDSSGVTIKAGMGNDFRTDLSAGEVFEVPPAFIGAYEGDIDDGGNSLRKYLFAHSMPEQIRKNEGFPKVEWNAFAALAKKESIIDPEEKRYYPLIDDIAPLGFEEVVIDIGWWKSYGDPGHIVVDSADWPSGMPAAAKYARDRGMRFGLYDNESENLTSDAGRSERISDIAYLIEGLGADFYRSDATAGPVVGGSFGKEQRAKYQEDVGYWSIKGFYEVIDSLYRRIPSFLWENCSSGGGLKDYGAVKRAARVQNQDIYYPVMARRSFYDATFAMHPMQLACVVGSWEAYRALGSVYEFRSASMGAAYWHPDAPRGGNWGSPWPEKRKDSIKRAVNTYKTKLRPLIRNADLYHIFPRPDEVVWDGIEYYDRSTHKGVVYIFKHKDILNMQVIKLKGLDQSADYTLSFEDGTNETVVRKGNDLMKSGIAVTLNGAFTSELMFVEKK